MCSEWGENARQPCDHAFDFPKLPPPPPPPPPRLHLALSEAFTAEHDWVSDTQGGWVGGWHLQQQQHSCYSSLWGHTLAALQCSAQPFQMQSVSATGWVEV